MGDTNVLKWTREHSEKWANRKNLNAVVLKCIRNEDMDGKCLLALTESDIRDLRDKYMYELKIGDIKRFWLAVRCLQRDNHANLVQLGLVADLPSGNTSFSSGGALSGTPAVLGSCVSHSSSNAMITSAGLAQISSSASVHPLHYQHSSSCDMVQHLHHPDLERVSPPLSIDGRATSIQPEFFKTTISLGYAFLVTWITAIVMVVVHERVPDMKRYPPLPDIFLDNVPHIPWAFHMCEITGTLLFTIWACVLVVHKHRVVLLRRFFALAGTVFLLRCVTMLITSLSVPGTHLQCNPNDFKVDDTNLTAMESIFLRISRAYTIWSGLGMSIRGVRTCGDYMFSGHTVALTTLNFFITEYTPRHLYFLHTMTWLLNMFGIFFILAAHEHYSIDVFVAFYITSRLFLYYHTLANNQVALMSHDSNRTRIWFPMFSYFESSVDGIIPNEYDSVENVFSNIFSWIFYVKDCCMLTARRFWIAHNQFTPLPNNSQINYLGKNLNNFIINSGNKLKELNGTMGNNEDFVGKSNCDSGDGIPVPVSSSIAAKSSPIAVKKQSQQISKKES